MIPSAQKNKQLLIYLVLLGVLSIAFGFGLFNHGPIPAMETRFAVAVRQMLMHGSFIVPIKNRLPYIEYPPFYYWMAIAGRETGLPLLAAIRLPNLIALWLWAFWLWRFGKRLMPARRFWLWAVAGISAPALLYNFFIAQVDGWLALGVLIAFSGYLTRLDKTTRKFPWELWSGISIAVFAKGPVGLALTLPVMALDQLAVCMLSGNSSPRAIWTAIANFMPFRGIALAVLPLAAWYIAAGINISWDFVRAAFVYDNITRFLRGAGGHHNPWWLYAKTFWGDYFPLSLLFPLGLLLSIKRLRRRDWRLCFIWSCYTIIFFSLSASKQSKYILPAAPAFVALGFLAIESLASPRLRYLSRRAVISICALLISCFTVLATVWLPMHSGRIDDASGYAQLRGIMAANPGKIYCYQWPRSLILYELGSPMPWFRSARELYTAIAEDKMRAGSYLLVYRSNLPQYGASGDRTLKPKPAPPYFKRVLYLQSKGGIEVYRLLPKASKLSLPATPVPPPHLWWERFDTD